MHRSKFGVSLPFCSSCSVKNDISLPKPVVATLAMTDALSERIIDGLMNCWDEDELVFGSTIFLESSFCLLIKS